MTNELAVIVNRILFSDFVHWAVILNKILFSDFVHCFYLFSEIQIMFETVPSPEDAALAKELQLPSTFFLYKEKPPCPGCIGCEDFLSPPKSNFLDNKINTIKFNKICMVWHVSSDGIQLVRQNRYIILTCIRRSGF